MDKTLLLLAFLVANTTIFSQNGQYLDSLKIAIADLPKRDQIINILDTPSHLIISDAKNYKYLINKAIQYSKDIKDTMLMADCYASKTYIASNEENINLAFTAIRLYEKLKQPKKVAGMYTSLGWQLKYRDFDKAFKYYQKGLNILERLEDKTKIDPIYDNYGVLQGMKKNWDSALIYHNKSLKIKKRLNDSLGIPFGYSHLASVYLHQNKYDKALKYLDSALVIRLKRNDVYGLSDSYLYYGDLYFIKGDYRKAIDYFQKGYDLAKEYDYFLLKKYATEYLYKSHDSLNDYKEALKYNVMFNILKDSMLNVETNSKISELEIQYQTENKQKEILSQRAELAERDLAIGEKNLQIYGLGALAVILLLLAFILYNYHDLKHKQLKRKNELSDAMLRIETQNKLQEQRLRISRDLHDNIGAQLTFIISSLDNLKYAYKLPDKLDNRLSEISEFASATINELRDTIWAMNKGEITREDLQVRISSFIKKADQAATHINFILHIDDDLPKDLTFTSLEGINIYRILQEAINNATKYADATKISVDIYKEESTLKFKISDNGNGFKVNDVEEGNGLRNMKKRAREIDAKYSIRTSANTGTHIYLSKEINT